MHEYLISLRIVKAEDDVRATKIFINFENYNRGKNSIVKCRHLETP